MLAADLYLADVAQGMFDRILVIYIATKIQVSFS